MVVTKQLGIKLALATATLMVEFVIGSPSGGTGMRQGIVQNRHLEERRAQNGPGIPSIPGVEDKVIDCGCPETCHDAAIQEHSSDHNFDCLSRIAWLMKVHDEPEANACMWASKNPDFTDEANSHRPCPYELCHPEGCNSYLKIDEHVHDVEIHCGCPNCDDEALNAKIGPNDFTCLERIKYTMHKHEVSQWHACDKMHTEGSCSDACDPKTCHSTLPKELPLHAPWKEGRHPPGVTDAPTTKANRPANPNEESETEIEETKEGLDNSEDATEEEDAGEDELDGNVDENSQEGDEDTVGVGEEENVSLNNDNVESNENDEDGVDEGEEENAPPNNDNVDPDDTGTETGNNEFDAKVTEVETDNNEEEVETENNVFDNKVSEVEPKNTEEEAEKVAEEEPSELASDEFKEMANESESSGGTNLAAIVGAVVVCGVALVVALDRLYRVRKFKKRASQGNGSTSYSDNSPFGDAPFRTAVQQAQDVEVI